MIVFADRQEAASSVSHTCKLCAVILLSHLVSKSSQLFTDDAVWHWLCTQGHN